MQLSSSLPHMKTQEVEQNDAIKSTSPPKHRNLLETLRTCYLFLYNLLQFLGFLWTFSSMTADIILMGQGAMNSVFSSCSTVLYCCQILAILEVVNPALGLVKTPVLPALIQVMGRNLILFVVFGSLPEMQNRSVVFCVFYLWSVIEIFRYPFYMLACLGLEWRILTWLRYSVWIPLYPLGTLAETVAVFQSLPIFDKTQLFSVPLPVMTGFSISFSFSLRVFVGLILFGLLINIRHLMRKRHKRFLRKMIKCD